MRTECLLKLRLLTKFVDFIPAFSRGQLGVHSFVDTNALEREKLNVSYREA